MSVEKLQLSARSFFWRKSSALHFASLLSGTDILSERIAAVRMAQNKNKLKMHSDSKVCFSAAVEKRAMCQKFQNVVKKSWNFFHKCATAYVF